MVRFTQVTQDAVFIGANKQGHIADRVPGLVAFGAGTTVALWNPLCSAKKGVYLTLNHHTKEVTCVRFVGEDVLLSAGEDGTICVWSRAEEGTFALLQTFQQDCSITTVESDGDTFVTGNSEGKLFIYRRTDGEFALVPTRRMNLAFLPTALALQRIENYYLLVVAGTTSDLYVFSFAVNGTEIANCAQLEGHEDWIKCLSFVVEKENSDYILASGSQDTYVRLWRLRLNEAIDDSDEDGSRLVLLSNKQHKFAFGEGRAAFSFEALIAGHDDWVTGLQWHPLYSQTTGTEKLQLLSLSANTALMIWEMDEESGVWVCSSRLGEMSIKGASTATGSSGGFWSCLWFYDDAAENQYILATGKTGAVRMYQSSRDGANWDAVLGVTGAVRDITDLVWSNDGTYVLSTSLDQTTRLIAPWVNQRPTDEITWHEFARPQIHGYDMICLDNLAATKFVSGGDEKILRVFEMTQSINNLLHKFCGVSSQTEALPEAASLPVLGLSNKAANEHLEAGEAQQREEDYENEGESGSHEKADVLASLNGPPLEDDLQRFTLFPEIEKLYGHGYEITCCATSPSNNLIASACRSNSAKHAVIRIFNAGKDYQLVTEVLKGHNLTITSMEFSPDGQYLLAVSRDRQISLWKVKSEEEGTFDLVELNEKAHTKIIWDCSWAPANDAAYFVTGSRDKSVKLWRADPSGAALEATLKTGDAVTAVSCFQTHLVNGELILAVGQESGAIVIYSVDVVQESKDFIEMAKVDTSLAPAGRVNKLSFSSKMAGTRLQLAVGSVDSSVRIYSVGTL